MAILAVTSDIGSFENVFPAAKILSERREVFLINSERRAKDRIDELERKGELGSIKRISTSEIGGTHIAAVLSGMSVDDSEYRVAAGFKEICPVIAIADQWWSPLAAGGWKERKIYPDAVCVNDEIGVAAARSSGFNGLVVKTGWPAFDKYVEELEKKPGESTLMQLGDLLGDKTKLIVFIGEGERENTEALGELVSVVASKFRGGVKILPLEHPNMRMDNIEEVRYWDGELERNKGSIIKLPLRIPDLEQILTLADVVVSDFSTVLSKAATIGKPVISILYPGKPIVERFRRWEWANGTFPLATLGCCRTATSKGEIGECLEEALFSDFKYSKRVKEIFHLDGGNAERVAKVVEGLIFLVE